MTASKTTCKKYNAASIEVLSGLDPVRKNPGMFTDIENPMHLIQEVVDNSVDEALAGYAKTIHVRLVEDGWIEVEDDGRGMPVDQHPQQKKSGVEVILTTLHAGGKFSDKNYQFSGGLHGVGVSVVNALSESFEAEIYRDSKIWKIYFSNGTPKTPLKASGKIAKSKTGTKIRFIPAAKYFSSMEIQRNALKHMLQTKAILCPRLRIRYEDALSGEQCQWYYTKDLSHHFTESLQDRAVLFPQHWVLKKTSEDINIDCCINWLTDYDAMPVTESYVNLIQTPRGGTHIQGLRSAVITAIREFAQYHQLLVPKNKAIIGEDITAGMSFVIALKMHRPEFVGQIKEKLSSRKAGTELGQMIRNAFSLWLNQHTQQGKALFTLISNHAERRRNTTQQKTTRKKILSHLHLPAKLADCSSRKIEETELFLVEGNSAGGSAKQARDRSFQAILPLRGKIMNTWETPVSQLLDSEEIYNISSTIGVKAGSSDLSGLRYGKICILADADSDGLHIASLLVALFHKHFPAVFEKGHLYVALPPLFRIDAKQEIFYAANQKELKRYLNKLPLEQRKKASITRFKGLGEMNVSQLKESVMNQSARHLLRLVCDKKRDLDLLNKLFTKSCSQDRWRWLQEKSNFATDLL